jgi:antitoxin ParD1/3/4
MATLNISIPGPLRDWIDSQVGKGEYASASDYVRELVREHRDRQMQLARLNELLREGEESGVSERSLDDVVADIRRRGTMNG